MVDCLVLRCFRFASSQRKSPQAHQERREVRPPQVEPRPPGGSVGVGAAPRRHGRVLPRPERGTVRGKPGDERRPGLAARHGERSNAVGRGRVRVDVPRQRPPHAGAVAGHRVGRLRGRQKWQRARAGVPLRAPGKLQHGKVQHLARTHVDGHEPLRGDVSPSRLLVLAKGQVLDTKTATLSETKP